MDDRDNLGRPVIARNTDNVRPTERFAYWREAITDRFLPLKPERFGHRPFFGELTLSSLGGLPLTSIRAQGQRITRDAITAPDEGYYFLNLQAAGSMRFGQGNAYRSVSGSGFMIDSSAPFILECETDMTHVCLSVPKTLLQERLRGRAPVGGRVLDPRDPSAALALSFLAHVSSSPPSKASSTDTRARDRMIELLASALDPIEMHGPALRDAVATAVYYRARALIQREAHRPELSAAAVALTLGVSLRKLQRVFRRQGDNASSTLIVARLTRAAAMLVDPTLRKWSITDVALRAGFSDLSYFDRCFAQRYGCSPRQFRRAEVDRPR